MTEPAGPRQGPLQGIRLADAICGAPLVRDASGARSRLRQFLDEAREAHGAALAHEMGAEAVRGILLGIADHSPYLWRLASSDAQRLHRILQQAPMERLEAIVSETNLLGSGAVDERQVMRSLRRAKQEVALLVALADIGHVWSLAEVTAALTRFADAAVSAALNFLLREAAKAGKLAAPGPAGCGIVVVALGKQGACELNYSSDIDILVLFEPAAASLPPAADATSFFVRLTKSLVRILQERSEDGYVVRVDLRLRPDPGSTAIAISLRSALTYYETVGQNWERAALIKARPVAGDLELGRRFLAELAPFIWRKYFDYAAIADIQAMKRQIHVVRGHGQVTVAGHDLKLGRGGIREIEFFVQTQQLIFGGRRPGLRGARTLDMLDELHRDSWITREAAQELAAAYTFLRTLEHRLQMLGDEQTHRLPADGASLERFAAFCGFASKGEFAEALIHHLTRVEHHYARLFEHAPELAVRAGSLVFTGTSDDPETLATLRRLGFKQPERAAETIRGWHFGRRAAVQSARAREVLTELVPGLIDAFSRSGDPDAALTAFDAALSRMPAAVELFAILKSNDAVRALFADILGSAPRLAKMIAMRPHVLDAAIDPALASSDEAALEQRVMRVCSQAASFEDFLDRARDARHEESFLIGARLLSGAIAPEAAGRAYSVLAETLVRLTFAKVAGEFGARHGQVPGGRCAVLALGRLGSSEMSARSDLDLVLIYDFDQDRPLSDGAKALHAVQYYARLTQRLISALTVPTRRGPLYAVDLRLRPSGNKGPIATQFEGFLAYQHGEAETWEHLALTRARVIAGDRAFAQRVSGGVREILRRPRPRARTAAEVREMRALIAKEREQGGTLDLKIGTGGLLDIEFLAQFLILTEAHAHPELIGTDTCAVLHCAADAGLIDGGEAETLMQAHRLMSGVAQLLATCTEEELDAAAAPPVVLQRIAAALNMPGVAALDRELGALRAGVRPIFDSVLAAGA